MVIGIAGLRVILIVLNILLYIINIFLSKNHENASLKRQWCSGNINAFQAFALDSISGWRSFLAVS